MNNEKENGYWAPTNSWLDGCSNSNYGDWESSLNSYQHVFKGGSGGRGVG
jgi:hypothetical protein